MTTGRPGFNDGAMAMRSGGDRPRVLIVQDDFALRLVLQDLCSEWGWSADGAGINHEAITVAAQQQPQLVLLTVNPSQRHWLSLVRDILTACPTTPVLAMMSELPEDVIAIELAGAVPIVGDPRSLTEIAALLNHFRPAGPGAARHAQRLADACRDDRAVRHGVAQPMGLEA